MRRCDSSLGLLTVITLLGVACSSAPPGAKPGDGGADAGAEVGVTAVTATANGGACTGDVQCRSGACVDKMCGVRSCEQLSLAPLGSIEVDGLLESSAPEEDPPGGTMLLAGDFDKVTQLCFDGLTLTRTFEDAFNAMVEMPLTAQLGAHAIRAIRADGRVSTALAVHTVVEFTRSRIVKGPGGILLPVMGASAPGSFMPMPKAEVDPITNLWRNDSDDTAFAWSLVGAPWTSPVIDGQLDAGDFPAVRPTIKGTFDVAHKRVHLTVTPEDCASGKPCAPWDYVGVFSCAPIDPLCKFDPCREVRDPADDKSVANWDSTFPRELVLFPVGKADPQGVLRIKGDTCF